MTEQFIHDVVIIGAGPCGLAVASRLCEHSPSALFTDEEHQRYHWIRKYGRRMPLKNRRNGSIIEKRTPSQGQRYSTLVLDATGDEWLNRWNRLFKTFDITHLRSPMFFHVDPSDRDALLARAHERNQEHELQELRACVGKEISKHLRKARLKSRNPKQHAVVEVDERDRKDYFTPPTTLFANHCECIVDRYGLREGLIQNEKVEDIEYRIMKEVAPDTKLFAVRTNKGTHYARAVVLAVGPANAPTIPPVLGLNSDACSSATPPQVCHSMQIQTFPDPVVQAKIAARKTTNVLVVGGGLTSAQLSDLAIRRGVTKVWHLMRGPCKVKPFDIDLSWMGKFRNVEQAYFWSADSDEERLKQIQSARGGGSITPPYQKRLKQHMARGTLGLHTNTRLVEAHYDAGKRVWDVRTEPAVEGMPGMDYIYFATGVQTDYAKLPYLQTMLREHPIHGHGGIPCITDDLMWSQDVPLFVTGRMAALRLGPGAANLAGARAGAERVAWAIEDLLPERTGDSLDDPEMNEEMRFVTGRGNRFDSLVAAGGEDC
ncbi:FAD binding domain-containing protein [Colletotrichum tabaci]|uniref:FAD binding domain-containing protein n=1 Tax=Colletotrichum tabaci TaxID=1209068 RepID=A0AAV9TBQ0_9PEZI